MSSPQSGVELMSVRGSTRHWAEHHLDYVVALIHDGQPGVAARWRSHGATRESQAGDLMLMEPGSHHVTQKVWHGGRGASFSLLRISPALVENVTGVRSGAGPHFEAHTTRDPETARSIAHLVACTREERDPLELDCATTEVLGNVVQRLLSRRDTRPLDGVRHYGVRAARSFLHDHLERRPNLEAVAEVAGLSTYGLCHAFRSWLGTSPGRYWTLCRLAHARRRLEQGVPAREISKELSFSDESHFNRVFKKHYGVPPGRFARHRRNVSAG